MSLLYINSCHSGQGIQENLSTVPYLVLNWAR